MVMNKYVYNFEYRYEKYEYNFKYEYKKNIYIILGTDIKI